VRGTTGYGSRSRHNGSLVAEPPAGVQGQTLGGSLGGEAPLKLKNFFYLNIQQKRQNCHISVYLQYFARAAWTDFLARNDVVISRY